ncbi:YppG family protein [Virgibacillus pantothenticus]|uniref:YppG family protein n=1 Tax=Virgibacillus pantothenticus TaxID=1473 RepID=UPI001C2428AD|nr:YppG family protein [Virgibacillus pantothenticus]MBU8566343.1 YppG family protein [Virgibacillus pantothenticus]MBU8600766.1 YppG family protein [Virgibacillus pantothenticus]MBU8634526.1 YppG family protein [Virgibacillus pantothenticus]MBU8640874.1 YppG family protein [Virgibacillus pantothenticus]MBU8646371.1 YppG family protein [Virgibacillus pantothenticus]
MIMFPNRPIKQPMNQHERRQPMWIGRPMQTRNAQQTSSRMESVLSSFRNAEGEIDLNKITEVASQVHKLYGQVSPLLTSFVRKK